MEIKDGYKKTEVGVIPEDWEAKQLKSVCLMKSGNSITSENISDFEKYPCYGGNGLRGYTNSYTHSGKYGLIGRQGALCGNVNFVDDVFFASEHAVVVTPGNNTDIKWLTYILFRMNLNQYSESSAQPGLSVNKILILPIPVPPTKSEQTAIATALSDADALINSLEKLIAKKRNIKQGAMQKLLQPKEGWTNKSIKQISIDLLQGVNTAIDIPEYVEDGVPMLKANNIIEGEVNLQTADHISYKTFQGYNERFKIKKNDFLFSNIGARLGTGSLMKKDIECSFAWNVMRIIPNTKLVSPEYMNCIMNSSFLFNEIKKNESGSGMGFVPKNIIQNIELPIPPTPEEQNEIATILSDMDAEIQALETKLEKYRQIKLGMMQNLLTGKIRLV